DIANAISKDIAASVIYAGSAALLWQDLETRFSQSNAPRIFELKRSLMSLTQGSLSVSQYFTKLKILWEELNTFKPLVSCSCGGVKPIQAFLDQEYVMLFLMGLNENLASVRSQILLSDPLPPIGKVFSLVLQEEKQRALTSPSQHMAFAVKQSPRPTAPSGPKVKGRKDRSLCAHCGLLGHTEDKCYRLHGYPPGYSQNKPVNAKSQVHHIAKVAHDQESQDPSPTSSFSLTAAQYNQLMTLLQTQQALQDIEPEICAGEVFSSCYSNQMAEVSSWIVDSGATTHITNSFKFLENAKPLTNHFVALPDHTKIRALAIGNVVLNSSLILYNVIFIPSFRVNLISVSSLLKLSNCTVLFSDLAFIIQDRTSKKVIGRGDETDDLFLLQSPFTVHTRSSVHSCRSVTNVDSTIWHARL
ncbi:hypothetical protein S83_063161, partial [Arachis hypogaea]